MADASPKENAPIPMKKVRRRAHTTHICFLHFITIICQKERYFQISSNHSFIHLHPIDCARRRRSRKKVKTIQDFISLFMNSFLIIIITLCVIFWVDIKHKNEPLFFALSLPYANRKSFRLN